MKLNIEEFLKLDYGDVVLATSIDCTDTKKEHVCIIISNGTVEHISKKTSKSVKFALCLSSTDSKEGQQTFNTFELPEEIQQYYTSINTSAKISKLRNYEPITILRSGIKRIFKSRLDSMLQINNAICDLLCSEKYIFYNLVKRGEKYKNQIIHIGEICPCYDYGQACANEIKICPDCHVFNDCFYPDEQHVNYFRSQIECWINRLKELGFDEITAYCELENTEVANIVRKLENDKCELMAKLNKFV